MLHPERLQQRARVAGELLEGELVGGRLAGLAEPDLVGRHHAVAGLAQHGDRGLPRAGAEVLADAAGRRSGRSPGRTAPRPDRPSRGPGAGRRSGIRARGRRSRTPAAPARIRPRPPHPEAARRRAASRALARTEASSLVSPPPPATGRPNTGVARDGRRRPDFRQPGDAVRPAPLDRVREPDLGRGGGQPDDGPGWRRAGGDGRRHHPHPRHPGARRLRARPLRGGRRQARPAGAGPPGHGPPARHAAGPCRSGRRGTAATGPASAT